MRLCLAKFSNDIRTQVLVAVATQWWMDSVLP